MVFCCCPKYVDYSFLHQLYSYYGATYHQIFYDVSGICSPSVVELDFSNDDTNEDIYKMLDSRGDWRAYYRSPIVTSWSLVLDFSGTITKNHVPYSDYLSHSKLTYSPNPPPYGYKVDSSFTILKKYFS